MLLDRPSFKAVFADFWFDPLHLELRKAGCRIRLETKPAQILALLLQQHGKLVTREDLRAALWADEIHLDFEHGLNKSIHKLRSVLSDDSEAPRFVETISRRGYRFIAPVELVPNPLPASVAPTVPPPDAAPVELSFPAPPPSDSVRVAPPGKPWYEYLLSRPIISWTAAISAAALVVALVYFSSPLASRLHSKPARRSVAVLGFLNLSGDPKEAWLSTAFSEWLSVDLCAGEQLRLVSPQSSSHPESELGLDSIGSLSPQQLSKLGKILHADLVISGSYAVAGDLGLDQIRLDVFIRDTSTGETVKTSSFLGDRAHIFALATQAGTGLREALNLPPASSLGLGGVRAALPLDPDAARFYAEGLQYLRTFDDAKAVELFTKAEQIEPLHAMTHFGLARAWTRLGHSMQAKAEAKKALDLSASLSREQLLIIRGQYHESIQDWNSAAEDYSALFRFFPDVVDYGVRLASVQIAAARATAAFDTLTSLRRLPPPLRDDPSIDLAEAGAASASSDFPHQRQAAAVAASKGQQQRSILLVARAQLSEGEALRSLGQFQAALDLWQSAQGTFAAAGDHSGVAQTLNREAFVLWKMNQGPEAEKRYLEAISTSRSISDQSSLAGALAGLANILIYQDQPVRTRSMLLEAVDIYSETGNLKEQAYTISLLGDLEMINNRLPRANEFYEQALVLSRQAGDRSRIAGRLMDLGIVDTWQGNLVQASEKLNESLRLYRELGEKIRVSYVLHRMARVAILRGNLEEARKDLEESIKLREEVGDRSTVWQPRIELAWNFLEMGKADEAESIARQSLGERAYGNEPLSWILVARALLAQGKTAESNDAYRRALNHPPHYSGGEFEVDLALCHSQLLASQGNFVAAKKELLKADLVARNLGWVTEEMKVRLTKGELELQSGEQAKGLKTIEALQRDAEELGFGLFVAKAKIVLSSSDFAHLARRNGRIEAKDQ